MIHDEPFEPRDAPQQPPGPPQPEIRRLYRSRTDRMIGGVAGGLANYLGIDPILSRLIWVALLFTGAGFLIYIVAWIVIPEAPVGMVEPVASPASSQTLRVIFGVGLVFIGAILLLREILPWIDDGIVWAVLLVCVGAGILVKAVRS